MSGSLDVGTLTGTIELKDSGSSVLESISSRLEGFEETFTSVGEHIAEHAAGYLSAEVAFEELNKAAELLVDELKDLTTEGAVVGEISDNFEHLTSAAGMVGDTLIGGLRDAVHGTISDFELMKSVNGDLAAGMHLTQDQFDTLGKAAFTLAQTTGVDVKTAWDQLNESMLTGQTRGVKSLTGYIDLTTVEQSFAQKIGTTTDRLNEEGKAEAIREAILSKVTAALGRMGEGQDDLKVKVEQTETAWANFQEDLGKAVSTSPTLIAGIDAAGQAIEHSFGGNQDALVHTLQTTLEGLAIDILQGSEYMITAGGEVGVVWNGLEVVFDNVRQAIGYLGVGFDELGKTMLEITSFLEPQIAGQLHDSIALINQDMSNTVEAMAERVGAMKKDEQAEQEWTEAAAKVKDIVDKIKMSMKAAQQTEQEHTKTKEDDKKATDDLAASLGASNSALNTNDLTLQQTNSDMKAYQTALQEIAVAGDGWEGVLEKMNGDVVEGIKYYLQAGVSQSALAAFYGVTANQISAVSKALQQEQKDLQQEQKITEDSAKNWALYQQTKVDLDGSATDKVIANIDKWTTDEVASHVKAKTDTEDFYNWLGQMRTLDLEKADQARLLQDQHSKAYWQSQAQQAEDNFEFAESHASQFTQDYIAQLQQTRDAAREAAQDWQNQMGGALGQITDQVTSLTGDFALLDQQVQKDNSSGGSFDINRGNLDQELNYWSIPLDLGHELAQKGFSFQEILEAYQSGTWKDWKPQGPRIPGFSEGGVGDFGSGTLAMLHGREMIVPLDKMGSMGAIQIYVSGVWDPRTVTQMTEQIKAELLNQTGRKWSRG